MKKERKEGNGKEELMSLYGIIRMNFSADLKSLDVEYF